MRFDILTLFPDFFTSPLNHGVIGRAVSKGILTVGIHNIRDFTDDKHRTTDDYPYGGGAGMVMKVEPVARAIEAVRGAGGMVETTVVLTTPQGARFGQDTALDLKRRGRIAIVCGRYEGFDERIRGLVDMEISAGDYILTGGEVPALMIMDAVGRLIPDVLGEPSSPEHESFGDGLLEYPQYTRPEEWRGMKVPSVLLSGDHAGIERWRRQESIARTLERRPDLLKKAVLSDEERAFIGRLRPGPRN
ncbi:MAG: tRNA (guanosine(37)-N1)-methyltransferase TrmD [Deltaproteobacteria bacterium]|nr:tRNA (guanosine(37)-N1)-methyltransferase TrmD [Deltaproteobacteria bacterium]